MEKYDKFFKKIKEFKKEQNLQKQRGLNNYNILTSVLNPHDEVRLHSRMIYSLLNPHGEHYQSSLFLDKFLEVIGIKKLNFKFSTKNCSTYKEYENIDLYITDGNRHIIIENKVYAKDQKNQIKRYIEKIQKENEKLSKEDILVVYLSLDAREPSPDSLGGLEIEDSIIKNTESQDIALFRAISYEKDILSWLYSSQYEIQNITNLNEVFSQYIDVVKILTNTYKDKIMSLADYIKNNEDIYKMAVDVGVLISEARKGAIEEFANNICNKVKGELGNEWEVEVGKNLSKKYSSILKIYKKEWLEEHKDNKDIRLVFSFDFSEKDYYNGYCGILRYGDGKISKEFLGTFEEKMETANMSSKDKEYWLHKELFPIQDANSDFAKYVIYNENAEAEFIEKFMSFIKKFESENNLMTELNQYLRDN